MVVEEKKREEEERNKKKRKEKNGSLPLEWREFKNPKIFALEFSILGLSLSKNFVQENNVGRMNREEGFGIKVGKGFNLIFGKGDRN
jgi:hypothetical protein